ncbi:MAG: exodeoxyribonuclease VII large subunit, partial [Solirubrobacteraceae bacterium]
LSHAPARRLAAERSRLHQLTRELRAGSRRRADAGLRAVAGNAAGLERAAVRGAGPQRAQRARDLERLVLALAAHDPQRTLARGYVLVEDRSAAGAGAPLSSAADARRAAELTLRFADGSLDADVRP